jgi:hypothetical protein
VLALVAFEATPGVGMNEVKYEQDFYGWNRLLSHLLNGSIGTDAADDLAGRNRGAA